eukprot:CAMPEP_0203745428 /NCGR_PEP_ID=MMETSP0098-20131031/1168_1 /ASSEMBLY_ACC=CAM_ASM_000208 /TAXON_ID=96639 /ORGANISM=" , Strain NY0313808BC1" /LENGTH=1499 /DNA_ID=CAMNT_0050633201 /DNA_START=695 /DNA_END=5194 /DNA_ORIENTATION=-
MVTLLQNAKNLQDALRDTDNDFQGEDMFSNRQSIIAQLRLALFGSCYTLLNHGTTKIGWYSFLLGCIIKSIQLASFIFSPRSGFRWPLWVESGIVPVVEYSTFSGLLRLSTSSGIIVFMFVNGLVLTTTCGLTWIGLGYTRGRVGNIGYVVSATRRALDISTGVLFIPVVTTLLNVFRCDEYAFSPCSAGSHLALQLLASLSLVIFIPLSLLYSLVMVVNNPNSDMLGAKAHGRYDAICRAVEIVLAITYTVVPASAAHGTLAIALCGALLLAWMNCHYLPYYKMEVNQALLTVHFSFLWGVFCLALQIALDKSYTVDGGVVKDPYGSFMTYVAGLPVIMLATNTILQKRISDLKQKPHVAIESAPQMELRLRLEFSDGSQWNDCRDIYRDLCDQKFPKNGFFHLHLAVLIWENANNQLMSGQYIRKTKEFELSIDEQFRLFVGTKEQEKRNAAGGNTIDFMAYEYHHGESVRRIMTSVELILSFWTKLSKETCTEQRLISIGKKFYASSRRSMHHLEALLRISYSSPSALEVYSCFLKYALNDARTAKAVMALANDVKDKEGGLKNDDGKEMLNKATCVISGSASSLGVIIDATTKVCTMFQTSHEELVGKKINMLCPPPFDIMHDLFLKRYLEEQTSFVTVNREVWGLHSAGYVLPLKLQVTPQVNQEGEMIFVGQFTIMADYYRSFLAVDTKTKVIKFASKECWEDLLADLSMENGTHSLEAVILPEEQESLFDLIDGGTDEIGQILPFAGRDSMIRTKRVCFVVDVRGESVEIDITLLTFGEKPELELQREEFGLNVVQEKGTIRQPSRVSHADKSVASSHIQSIGSSSSNSSLNKSIFAQVERGLASTEKKTKTFRWTYLLSSLLCLALVLVEWINRKRMYTVGTDAVNQVHESCLRAYYLVDIAIMLHAASTSVLALRNGYIDTREKNLTKSVHELLGDIEKNVDSLANLHVQVTGAESSNTESLIAFNTKKDIQVVGDVRDPYSVEIVDMWIGVHTFVGHVNDFIHDSKEELQICNESKGCLFALNNGPMTLVEASVEASYLYRDEAVSATKDVKDYELVIMFVMLGLSTFGILTAFWPKIIHIWNKQARIAAALFSIPRKVCKAMQSRTKEKIVQLSKQLNLHDEESESESDDGGKNVRVERVHSSLSIASGDESREPLNLKDHEVPTEKIKLHMSKGKSKARVAPLNVDAEPVKNTKKMRRSCAGNVKFFSRSVFCAVFGLGWSYISTLAYLGIGIYLEESRLERRLALGREIYLAGRRWVDCHELQYFKISEHGEHIPDWSIWKADPEAKVQKLRKLQEDFAQLHEVLVYGSAEHFTEGVRDRASAPQQFDLLFVSGCNDMCKKYPDLPLSRALGSGLHSGVEAFLSETNVRFEELKSGQVVPMTPAEELDKYHESHILSSSLELVMKLYVEELTNIVNQQIASGELILGLYLLSLIVSAYISDRVFCYLNRRLAMMQFILCTIPAQLISDLPQLEELFDELKSKKRSD